MAGAKVPITFRIFKGDTFIREETLSQPVIKVGKLSSSHLRLDDDSVSRMHAVIEVTGPGDVNVIDLGSTKGTHVNGQKVNKAKLQSGDQILVGETRIEITIGGGAKAAAAPPSRAPQAPPNRGPARPAPGRPPSGRPAAPAAARGPAAPPPGMRAPASRAASPVAPPRGRGPAAPAPASAPTAAAGGAAMAPSFGMDSAQDVGGARAIEVAAMLEGSVVSVKHVMDPRGGKVTPLTYGLFAGGAVMMVIAAFAFSVGVGNATFNKESKEAWNADPVTAKDPHGWRPKLVSLAYDWMAFGGLAGGLFCFSWAMVRIHGERRSPFFRIGSDAEVEFPTSLAPAPSFPIVAPHGDEFMLSFTGDMKGEMNIDGNTTPLVDLASQGQARASSTVQGAYEMQIPNKARIKLQVGSNTFLVSSVPKPRRHTSPLFASLESRVLTYFAGSAIVHMSLWALLNAIPPDPEALTLDMGGAEGRLTRVQSKAQEDPKEEEEEVEKEEDDSGGTGTAMALESGKMGKEESKRDKGQFAMKNNNKDPQLAKKDAIDNARNSGILGSLKAPGGAFSSLTGTGDISSGLDDANVFGGLDGNEVGEASGGFGMGKGGFGPGGGGTGWGTVGTGGYGTIGHGSGTGRGYGTGSGRGGMRGRKASPPQVRIGNAVSTGDLDKNIIRRYIRRKLPRIKYCYEKQLLVKPSISGDVISQFQISPQGSVLNSTASGVSKEVSSCVAGVIKTIQFPKPKGGGLVQVRYPFTFRPTGG